MRASNLMPAFDHGETDEYLGPSTLARQPDDEDYDSTFFMFLCTSIYTCISIRSFKYSAHNRFVDRDMYMRYLGGGIGHREQGVSLATSRTQTGSPTHARSQLTTRGHRTTGIRANVGDKFDSDSDSESGDLEDAKMAESASQDATAELDGESLSPSRSQLCHTEHSCTRRPQTQTRADSDDEEGEPGGSEEEHAAEECEQEERDSVDGSDSDGVSEEEEQMWKG